MSKTMEGMADAAWSADDPSVSGKLRNLPATEALEVRRMKAALLYLADNVSDEMADAVLRATSGDEFRQRPEEDFDDWTRRLRKAAIAAALRQAAGGEG